MVTIEPITTAEQLLQAPDLGRCEFVRGELVMMSPADPHAQTVTDYRGRSETVVLTTSDTLTGGAILPGFSAAVAEVFAR